MGTSLLVLSVGALLIMWFIDFFNSWYARFLKKWMPDFKIRVLLGQLVWAILAVLFWRTLYKLNFTDLLDSAYFFFVLFIYCVKGLIDSFLKSRGEKSIYR